MKKGVTNLATMERGADASESVAKNSAYPIRISKRVLIILASSLVPLGFDAVFLQQLWRLRPVSNTMLWEVPGIMVVFSWGTFAVICGVLIGILIGLPAAFFEAIRYRYGALEQGGASEVIMVAVPWLITFAAAELIGARWFFPPVAGPLIVVNTLAARAIPSSLAALVSLWSPLVVEDEAGTRL